MKRKYKELIKKLLFFLSFIALFGSSFIVFERRESNFKVYLYIDIGNGYETFISCKKGEPLAIALSNNGINITFKGNQTCIMNECSTYYVFVDNSFESFDYIINGNEKEIRIINEKNLEKLT